MLLRAVSCVAFAFALSAQTPSGITKQTDIGANDAPLTEGEREDLAKAVNAHNYTAEKAVLDKAAAENPRSAEIQILVGRLAFLAKQPNDAVQAFQRAAKIKPLSGDDRASMALAYEGLRMKKESLATVSELVHDYPSNAGYAYLKGRLEVQYGNNEGAITDFRKAISLAPDDLQAYVDLGQAQEALGQTDQARKTYEIAVLRNRSLKPPLDSAPLSLGELLVKSGDLDTAEKLFNEALRYRPRSAWAHYDLAQVYIRRGHRNEAIEEYRAAVVDNPRLRQAWLALGREYTRTGQKAEADKCLAIFKKLEEAEKQAHLSSQAAGSQPAAQSSAARKTP